VLAVCLREPTDVEPRATRRHRSKLVDVFVSLSPVVLSV